MGGMDVGFADFPDIDPRQAFHHARSEIHSGMHENHRSPTGVLPSDEFEEVTDKLFAKPSEKRTFAVLSTSPYSALDKQW